MRYIGTNLKNREINRAFQLKLLPFVFSSFVINKNAVIMKKNETLVCPNWLNKLDFGASQLLICKY